METTRIIENYLEGNLPEDERRDVEARAEADPVFRRLIDLHREVNECISDTDLYDLHQKINAVLSNEAKPVISGNQYKRFMPFLKIAAVFIFIAGSLAITSILLTGSRENRLYNKYYKPYEADIIIRAGDSADKLSQAIIFYNRKDYGKADSLFTLITASDQKYYIAWFFRGITSMQMSDFDDALGSFSAIPDTWSNPYNEHRHWYQALALLHEKETDKATAKFEEISREKGFYAQPSDAILSSLRR